MNSGVVTIIGRPSAGKSTFLNTASGEKVSIVSAIPQTTRNAIRGIVNTTKGQIVFIDTPGYHKSEKKLNLKEIKLQDAEHFVDKFGSKKEILYLYQLDKTGDLDENISLNSELSKKLEKKYKKDRAFYLTFWNGMLFLEILYLILKKRKNVKTHKNFIFKT